jgi:L-fuculose-phosphate aldolase
VSIETVSIELRKQLCEIGRRMYDRQFCAANEGNLSCRLSDDEVLCTPTLHCKGFLQPDDLCTVDLQGNQLSGTRRRTSEILLHLEIYRQRPDVRAVVHCHPPHATAFAVAREPIPMGVLPEPEVFLGEVPLAPYKRPGTQEFAETIVPFVHKANTIILCNHGTVSYAADLEHAFWMTEILDAYCRILLNARQLGQVHWFTPKENRELLDLRLQWGFEDPRVSAGIPDEQLAEHPTSSRLWKQLGADRRAFPRP